MQRCVRAAWVMLRLVIDVVEEDVKLKVKVWC